jgi:tetratricopeptide (TPR) repeat protein
MSARAWLLAVAVSGCVEHSVVRVVEGVDMPGHYVSDWAYATYAYGAELEARGGFDRALAFYRKAVDDDPRSPELWTRIGALECLLGDDEEAGDAFAEAASLDERYEPLWRARAECAARRGQVDEAVAAAAIAAGLDPGRLETQLLYAGLLERAGRGAEAAQRLRELAVVWPSSIAVWEAVENDAAARDDAAWRAHAQRRLGELRIRLEQSGARTGGWAAVDAALAGGRLAEARRAARRARLDPALLAARALAIGRPELAIDEATLRLGADPEDGDAVAVLLLATYLTADGVRWAEAIAALDRARPPSAVGRWMVAELLLRHGGAAAAEAWLGSPPPSAGELRSRLRAELDRAEAAP